MTELTKTTNMSITPELLLYKATNPTRYHLPIGENVLAFHKNKNKSKAMCDHAHIQIERE